MAKAKTSITTENRSGSAADAAAKEKRTEMPLSDLHPFEGHPFKVLDDELMEQTVESIKQMHPNGLCRGKCPRGGICA